MHDTNLSPPGKTPHEHRPKYYHSSLPPFARNQNLYLMPKRLPPGEGKKKKGEREKKKEWAQQKRKEGAISPKSPPRYLSPPRPPDRRASFLEIFLAPHKGKPGLGIHVTFDMELAAQKFWPTEEHAGFGGGVDLPDAAEDHVPVWAAEVGGGAQTGDGILVRVDFVEHDVRGIVGLDICG